MNEWMYDATREQRCMLLHMCRFWMNSLLVDKHVLDGSLSRAEMHQACHGCSQCAMLGWCRGVFGCHTAFVLRRLRRLCEQRYNSHPSFVVTSATVANPKEHVQELLGEQHECTMHD